MMKKILFFILLILVVMNFPIIEKNANAEPSNLTFCTGTELGWNYQPNNCLATCGDMNVGTTYTNLGGQVRTLSVNGVSSCVGQATKFQVTFRKLELGTSDGWGGYRCTVLDDAVTVDLVSKSKGGTFADLKTDFKKCKPFVYDRLYLTMDRKFLLAGNTKYPDDSGAVVRTTATSSCLTDSLSETSDTLMTNLTYQDESTTNAGTACYVRPSNTWNSVFKKSDSIILPNTTSYTTDKTIEFDDYKSYYLVGLEPIPVGGFNTYTSSSVSRYVAKDLTFRAEFGDEGLLNGQKIDPTNPTRQILVFIQNSDTLSGNAVGKRLEKNKTQTITLSLFSNQQQKEYGIDFLFKRLANTGTPATTSNASFIGVKPGDPGVYFIYNQQ
jgi:hypothetical protein